MARKVIEFTVYGDAIPQGSWENKGNGVVIQAKRDSLHRWRRQIGIKAQIIGPHFKQALVEGPIAIRALFYSPRPKSRPRDVYKTTSPDLDKMCRAVGDSLTKVVWKDDDQIVCWHTWKLYTDGGARVEIEVWELEPKDVRAIQQRNAPQLALTFDGGK